MQRRPSSAHLASGSLVAGFAMLLVVLATGGLSSSFIDPDESAHYVNTLFLGDWVRAGLPSPMVFARDYYAHFPKLSIGHWPPGWYAMLTPLFVVARPSPIAALVLSAFVAGLPAGLILWAAVRIGRWRIGVAAAVAYLLLPLVVGGARHFLLDQPVTLVVGLAAIAWVRATERPGWRRFLLFAALAAFAPLVKGNGALIALVPAIDIVLGRRWALLRHPSLWVSALLAMAVVGPWYWVSFQISAGGFNYAPGLDYAVLALRANLNAIVGNIGWAGALLALVGVGSAWTARHDAPATARIAALAVAILLATLLFQSAIPVAIEERYVAPLLPWAVVLAMIGVGAIAGRGGVLPRVLAAVLALAALLPAATNLARLPVRTDLDAPAIAARIGARPGIWLVDGRAGGEGAVIAAAAHADRGRKRIWIARASQWLSTSDFMGRNYRVTAATPAAARAVLDRLGVAGVVSVAERGRLAYDHSVVLRAALADPAFASQERRFRRGAGSTLLSTRIASVRPNAELLSTGSGSANVATLGAALD
ncbi:ArnT family glycosyltransferase [Sphingomonas sp. ac-8]|uniref:ArnT family glycosyltransferase n=1 Tax=Sphingomonas sp. ac-8 TaxID=3242977 RepID=UPI003A7FBC4E